MLGKFFTHSFITIILTIISVSAWSAPNKEYSCNLTLVAKELPEGFGEATFERPLVAPGTHGGEPLEFQFGTHKISTQVDGRWRTLRWEREGQLISTVTTVAGSPYGTEFVVILVNPQNDDDQLSLSCAFQP